MKKIGRYTLLKSIGKGGMGEVYLAYDPLCERNVALKCIREDLLGKVSIRTRFLREARIAAQLTHPSIIPIYTIHSDSENLYYTMSYVEGETLREIFKKTKEQEKKGLDLHPIGGSIAALIRIFLNICEAAAYTHSKNVLHRDFKPENIIIGKYGEVMILDWGIADFYDKNQKKDPLLKTPTKVAGTVAYMAPERALGHKATVQTDIYSLGVILYQILTLELPFKRGSLDAFRKTLKNEHILDPLEVASYREIPHELSQIVMKCLTFSEKDRYQNMQELIDDLKNIVEGKPDWIFMAELDPSQKQDWEFQENIMLAKHTAITRHIDVIEWVSLMVSEETFSGNLRIEASILLEEKSSGIGILFGAPEVSKRKSFEEGYCLWIKANHFPQLFRSSILVVDSSEFMIDSHKWHHIKIEKVNEYIRCFIDDKLLFTYSSHIPLAGAHVGLLHKDTDFSLRKFKIFSGSHNVMVNCLAVPDAFFAHKDYDTALSGYRHIGRSFPGRAEGRDALFKSGVTLLEKAKPLKDKTEKNKLFLDALNEFENLHGSQGAPLEYLGKALVYKEMLDHEEEAKCLEFALRKYPKHPLLPILEEHIIFRMHESAQIDRESAYRLILLVVRYFPRMLQDKDTKSLIDSLQKHWETLPFIEKIPSKQYTNLPARLAVLLAFWTDKTQTLIEIIKTLLKREPFDQVTLENAFFCLLELGAYRETRQLLTELKNKSTKPAFQRGLSLIKCPLLHTDSGLRKLFELSHKTLNRKESRVLLHILKKMICREEYRKIEKVFDFLKTFKISKEDQIFLDSIFLWNFLLQDELDKASNLISKYTKKILEDENLPLCSPYGAYLYLAKGKTKAKNHFSNVLEKPFPPTTALLCHYLDGKIDSKNSWLKKAFYWEKQELYLNLVLFFRTLHEKERARNYEKKLDERYARNPAKKIRS